MRIVACVLVVALPSMLVADGKVAKTRPLDQLILELRDSDVEKKVGALNEMGTLGAEAKRVVPDLVTALAHPDQRVSDGATYVLGRIGPDAKDALPTLRMILQNAKPGNYSVGRLIEAIMSIDDVIDRDIARALLANSHLKSGTALIQGTYLTTRTAELVPFLIDLLNDPDAHVRLRAAETFQTMAHQGADKKSLISKLDEKTRKPIGPALLAKLDENDILTAAAAATALTHLDPELGLKAIPFALEKLCHQKVGVFDATSILGPVLKDAIPAGMAILEDEKNPARQHVETVLAHFDEAMPTLIKGLKNQKAHVRASCARALGLKYTAGTVAATDALVGVLNDSDRTVRINAAEALVRIDSKKSSQAIPVLTAALDATDEHELMRITMLLHQIGPDAKQAIPALIKILNDQRTLVRLEAALAITAIDPSAAVPAIPSLREHVRLKYRGAEAARALAEIGPKAKEAIDDLEGLLKEDNPHTRLPAAEAIARIDPTKVDFAVQTINAMLSDDKKTRGMVRSYAIESLRRIGPAAKDSVPTLEKLLKDNGPFHADVAILAVELGDSKPAREWIQTHLKATDPEADEVLETFHQHSAIAKKFLPELIAVLKDGKSPYIIREVAEVLAKIGPDAKVAAPALRESIKKLKTPQQRKEVEKALAAIEK